MDGVKCYFCYGDGTITIHLGSYPSDDCVYKLKNYLKDFPKIPYKIQGKEIAGIILDDLIEGEGNATI